MRKIKYNIILLFLISQLLYSQSSLFEDETEGNDKETIEESGSEEISDLPRGYRSILLGMEFTEVKDLLLRDSRFDFRGDPDVSIQKNGDQSLISSSGRAFIEQGFFQFNENALYLIILHMDSERIDFFSLQKKLTEKYGTPAELSPEGLFWKNEKVQLSLEYPLTIKYLDLDVFNSFIKEEVRLKSFQEISRSEFLEDF
jgi:hypothetical protein